MLPPRSFEDFPEDVQTRLLYEGKGHTAIKKNYESVLMKHLREPDCLRPISNREIKLTFDDPSNDYLQFYGLADDSTTHSILTKTIVFYNTKVKGTIGYKREQDEITSIQIAGDLFKPIFTNTDIVTFRGVYSYSNVLLPPSALEAILLRRGQLCHKHIGTVIRDYIEETVSDLATKLEAHAYLFLCASDLDMDLNKIVGYYDYEVDWTNEKLPFLEINQSNVESNINDLYESVMNELLMY